ncbi:MAG: hypothetical protein GY860_19060 [Desulfobacteraceae bacterium]|nr:hypothetical protein [Desulfobacteraceae bacterium]
MESPIMWGALMDLEGRLYSNIATSSAGQFTNLAKKALIDSKVIKKSAGVIFHGVLFARTTSRPSFSDKQSKGEV